LVIEALNESLLKAQATIRPHKAAGHFPSWAGGFFFRQIACSSRSHAVER